MSSDQLKDVDLSNKLEGMLHGSEFDKRLDSKIEEMEKRGLTEDQIMD